MDNPYATTEGTSERPASEVSAREREFLTFLRQHRDVPPGVWTQLRRERWPRTLLVIAVLTLFAIQLDPSFGIGVGAFGLGALVRDLARYRASGVGWPILASVVDWRGVEARLSGDPRPDEPPDPDPR